MPRISATIKSIPAMKLLFVIKNKPAAILKIDFIMLV